MEKYYIIQIYFGPHEINRSFVIDMCVVTILMLFIEANFTQSPKHSFSLISAWKYRSVCFPCFFHSLHLTWRDMQHLTVLTSKRNQLHDEVHRWRRNGVGLEFNHLFGYGVLDAGAMVKMAKDWKTVPERFHCVGGSIQELE